MNSPIAIVGASCRFPGVRGLFDLSGMLHRTESTIVPVPEGRKRNLPEGDYPAAGYFEEPALFDAAAFGISAPEACEMDLRQRMALELAAECFEDAGYPTASLAAISTGVFAGATWSEYGQRGVAGRTVPTTLAGRAAASIAGRISQVFGLTGPSLLVDCVTSSALSAVHLACQSLAAQECDLALALGVNLILSPGSGEGLRALGVLSRKSEMRPFDQAADGYLRGEGAGGVLLKRLADAVRDGDHIHATITASVIGHNGSGSSALSAPNAPAQSRLILECLRQANLTVDDMAYWEAHGTGTPAGDTAELDALGRVFGSRCAPLAVGSVKGNLGHLEAASGMAGLLKALLIARTGEIPPTRGHRDPRPMNRNAIFVPAVRSEFAPGARRAIGVMSLGLSGSNACAIVEAAPEARGTALPIPPVLMFSADSPAALDRYGHRLVKQSQSWSDFDLPSLCVFAARRNHLRYRRAVPARYLAELRQALANPGLIASGTLPDWARRFVAPDARGCDLDLSPHFPRTLPASHPDLPPREWVHQTYEPEAAADKLEDPREIVSSILGCPTSAVDRASALLVLGMDSLAAMELAARLQCAGYPITARELLSGASLSDIESRAAVSEAIEVRI